MPKITIIHNVYYALGTVLAVAIVVVVMFAMQTPTAHASGFISCTDFCDIRRSWFGFNNYNTCNNVCASGGEECGKPEGSTEEILQDEEECANACFNLYKCIIGQLDDGSEEKINALYGLSSCLTKTCNISIPLLRGNLSGKLEKLSEHIRQTIFEQVHIQQAQREGLCVLKNKLNKREVESILSRDIVETEITNVNVGDIVGEDEDARNILCTYSSIKLVMRYLFFIAGVATLTMILIAGFLWIKSQGETDKRDTAKKVLLTAVGGAVIVLLIQVILRIIPSLL